LLVRRIIVRSLARIHRPADFNECSYPCNGRVTENKYCQSQLKQTGGDASGGLLMLDLFFRPKTRRIDWWMIAMFLVSLISFAGVAAMIWMHSV
jgi:hypothetical protein